MNDIIIIENAHIRKELFIKSKRIKGFRIINNLNGKKLLCEESCEEFSLDFRCAIRKISIKASELKLIGVATEEKDSLKRYIISFKPFGIRDSKIKICLIYEIDSFKSYMRKHLEISFEKKGEKDIVLEGISFENFAFDGSLKYWTVPQQKDFTVPGYVLSWGQPIYVDTLYMGCEFPVAVNKIENCTASVSWYSGKKLSRLISKGKFVSYGSVLGCAQSDIFKDVQKAFFEYIRDISRPVSFRRQYNSWYDNMLDIAEDNLTASFLETEKALTSSGEKPLDSYVADDGWNDYNAGFWTFNGKFSDGLYSLRNLTEALGSHFGLWLGPRGGYTSDTIKFARKIQKAENGYVNKASFDICVGSEKYVKKTGDMLLDFQKRYNLNYFKLDGFAQKPCKNKKHDHLTGGPDNIYFYNDTWERWIALFEEMILNGKSDFWINLTSYSWPSPWFLKWANSVWIQISNDMGFIGKSKKLSDKDRLLNYRDEVYFDFYRTRQFQFPQRALYNHDPIYGNQAKILMSDDEYREYLFTMATRGTLFWELYYSYSMMNEAKWRINYSCLRFIEDNADALSNSVIFGGRPSESKVYGYGCFTDYEGIVSLRNSSDTEQTYTLRLDESIGVSKELSSAKLYQILPYSLEGMQGVYSYGDDITVNLKAHRTKILHFGKRRKPIEINFIKAVSAKALKLQFNQAVDISDLLCENNRIIKKTLLEDYMTAEIELENEFEKYNILNFTGVADIMGNKEALSGEFTYFRDNIIDDGKICGKGEFTLEINITDKKAVTFFRQGEELKVYVDEGFIKLKVGSFVLKSFSCATEAVQVTAVREINNVIKLYINKKLDSGMLISSVELKGDEVGETDGANIRMLNKALAYDEV